MSSYREMMDAARQRMLDGQRRLIEDLFAPLATHHDYPLPHNGTETSKAAAERERPAAEGHRVEIFECLALTPYGMTRLEIAERTGIKENTVNARCADLLKAGAIVEHGVRDGRKVLYHVAHRPAAWRDAA